MRNIKMIVEYDGTDYHGFQKQPELPTIQGALEKGIREMTGAQINLDFASRTDAGVHATGQVINFRLDGRIPVKNIPKILNHHLPPDIKIIEAVEIPFDFDARRAAKSRSYVYNLYRGQDLPVFLRKYVHQLEFPLDLRRVQAAALHLLGEHDFTSFSSAETEVENFVRRIFEIQVLENAHGLISIRVRANSFLNKMVRAIVGTLLDVGRGRRTADEVKKIREARNRSARGGSPFAPPHGLCLIEVKY